MAYRHGIYISEVPTSIVPPVIAENSMPVFIVTAPVNLADDPYNITNEPKLCYEYKEAVSMFGFSMKKEIWENYTACQVIYSQFILYSVAPAVIINVLDPKKHKTVVDNENIQIQDGQATIKQDGVLIDTVKLKKGSKVFEEGKHYTLTFDSDGFVVLHTKRGVSDGILESDTITASYDKLAPEKVTIYDVIGGYDNINGVNKGLELINEVFPRFRLVPGQIVAPKYSSNPTVASVMESKASNINGHFTCISLNDLPTIVNGENNKPQHLKYTDIAQWKTENNYIFARQYNCYPMLRNGEQLYFFSTQMAGLICKTDLQNKQIPSMSPSNKNLKINGLCYEDGKEVVLINEQANYLNGNGIVTAINFTNGWTAWGNRTGAYPSTSDVKDSVISIRRMFDYIGNTIVLTYWSKVDHYITNRRLNSIVDSINIWFNALRAGDYILGGRIEFLEAENQKTDLLDGIEKFHLYITPPPPAREMDFILEYDVDYLSRLFN